MKLTHPRFNAVLLLSMFNIFNFLTLVLTASIICNRIFVIDWPKIYLFLIGLFIVGVNSYLIFGGNKYEQIEQRYFDEGKSDRRLNNVIAGLYVIATIAAFALCLIYLNKHPIRHGGIKAN